MSPILLRMEIRAMRLNAALILPACMHFVIERMILLFLPSMWKATSILVLASICVCLHEMLCFPLRALLSLIIEIVRLPPKVLPVVSVHTGISWVWGIRVWAPHCLEVKHVEIGWVSVVLAQRNGLIELTIIVMTSKLVQQINCNFIFSMCKCAHISVVAWFNALRITWAELHLILFRMIEFFDSVVRARAAILKRALVSMLRGDHIRADLWSVRT